VFPLLGGIILFAAMVRTAIDAFAPDFGYTTYADIGGVFVLGVGSAAIGLVLMIIYNIVAPTYFRGRTLADTEVTESGEIRHTS
jgi:hypothetical protein